MHAHSHNNSTPMQFSVLTSPTCLLLDSGRNPEGSDMDTGRTFRTDSNPSSGSNLRPWSFAAATLLTVILCFSTILSQHVATDAADALTGNQMFLIQNVCGLLQQF